MNPRRRPQSSRRRSTKTTPPTPDTPERVCPRCGNTDDFTLYGDQIASMVETFRGGQFTGYDVAAWGDREGLWRIACGRCGYEWEVDALELDTGIA